MKKRWYKTVAVPLGKLAVRLGFHTHRLVSFDGRTMGDCSWEFTLGGDLWVCPIGYARVNMYLVSDLVGLRKRTRDAATVRREAGV